jgi:hypothetical protein
VSRQLNRLAAEFQAKACDAEATPRDGPNKEDSRRPPQLAASWYAASLTAGLFIRRTERLLVVAD